MPITSWTPQNIYRDVTSAYMEAVGKAVVTAKNNAPSETGTLRRSIGYAPAGVLSGYIGSAVSYAAAQERGASGHPISPRRKKALYNARAGFGPVRGPVQHPGNPATRFLDSALIAFKSLFGVALAKKVHL